MPVAVQVSDRDEPGAVGCHERSWRSESAVTVPEQNRHRVRAMIGGTRSGLASPFRSATATSHGLSPAGRSVFAPNVASPRPRRIETVEAPVLDTTRSSLPSLSRSAMATYEGSIPVGKSDRDPNVPFPRPSMIVTQEETPLGIARSPFPSPFRSAIVTRPAPGSRSVERNADSKSTELSETRDVAAAARKQAIKVLVDLSSPLSQLGKNIRDMASLLIPQNL